jgi:hypothetical protein
VPRADEREDEFVIASLRQAGLKDPEIETFIAAAKS